jgi:hypothetical protein
MNTSSSVCNSINCTEESDPETEAARRLGHYACVAQVKRGVKRWRHDNR